MITAMAVLLVLLLLAGAATAATLATKGGQSRAVKSAQALQAAEAAANIGWERISLARVDTLNVTTPCLSLSVGSVVKVAYALLDVNGVHWCASQSVSVPGSTNASYQVSELKLDNVLGINVRYMVGQATVGGVTRRVVLKLGTGSQSFTSSLFGTFALQTKKALMLANGQFVSGAGVRSDLDITMDSNSPLCHVTGGPITPGPGHTVTTTNGASTCGNSTTAAAAPLSYQTVNLPTLNDDARLPVINLCLVALDPCSPNLSSDMTFTARLLSGTIISGDLFMRNSAAITLKGNVYVFCNFNMQNGTMHIAPANGQPVQIYLGGCGGSTVPSATVQNQAKILNETGLGAKGLQFYMVGAGNMDINNASTTRAAIYAPLGRVFLHNDNTQIQGAVVADNVDFGFQAGGKPSILYDSTVQNIGGGTSQTSTNYPKANYAQCSSATPPSNNPLGGC